MNKLEIARELLKNTINIYLKEFIADYCAITERFTATHEENYQDDDLIRLDNCIAYIQSVNFDITDWMLFEIPIFYSHCFWNTKTKQAFDLAVWDIGEVIPRYIKNGNEEDAKSIQEAINNYHVEDYITAGR